MRRRAQRLDAAPRHDRRRPVLRGHAGGRRRGRRRRCRRRRGRDRGRRLRRRSTTRSGPGRCERDSEQGVVDSHGWSSARSPAIHPSDASRDTAPSSSIE
ncbi:MAG: hypothetical protein E6J91_21350 [Deltaproteobacteria bacterium]|nr:MAG: hypothetical protein E6J91_21350 [Deltaproteobacteria bacterium]